MRLDYNNEQIIGNVKQYNTTSKNLKYNTWNI